MDQEPTVITIDLSKVQSIIPTGCKHDYQPDTSDETENYIAMVCILCHRGYLKRKT